MKRVCLILFGALAVFSACDKPLDENQEDGYSLSVKNALILADI